MDYDLVVIGGGAGGCELAQAFARLGAQVTIIEAMDRLLGQEEPEVSTVITKVFRAEGIDVRIGQRVTKVEELDANGRSRVHVDGGEPVEADRVLVAIGRRPVTDGLDAMASGVELDERGFVKTDDYLRTTAAIGNAFGGIRMRKFKTAGIPWVTFTRPEVGRVGMAEADAPAGAQVAYLPLTEIDRAIAEDESDGFVKVVAGPRWGTKNLAGGRILGATVMCSRGGELVHEFTLAIRSGMFPARMALTTHAYPTWSVAVQQAVGQFFLGGARTT